MTSLDKHLEIEQELKHEHVTCYEWVNRSKEGNSDKERTREKTGIISRANEHSRHPYSPLKIYLKNIYIVKDVDKDKNKYIQFYMLLFPCARSAWRMDLVGSLTS